MTRRRAVRPKDLAKLAAIADHARREAKRPLLRAALHNVVYLAALESHCQSRPLTPAPFYKRRNGALCPALDEALRVQRKRYRRAARKHRALMARCRHCSAALGTPHLVPQESVCATIAVGDVERGAVVTAEWCDDARGGA